MKNELDLQLKLLLNDIVNYYRRKNIRDYHGRLIDPDHIKSYFYDSIYRFKEILNTCEHYLSTKSKLLDVGIAYGFYSIFLQEKSKCELIGTDLENNIPIYCAMLLKKNISVIPFDITKGNLEYPDNYFDFIIFSEVIEHLRFAPIIILRELHRLLKPGGHLLLTTPNNARIGNIIRLVCGRNIAEPFEETGDGFVDNRAHVREYTFSELKNILANAGFNIESRRFSTCHDKKYKQHSIILTLIKNMFLSILFWYRGCIFILATK